MKGWVRVNQDDLGDRRTCENMVRTRLGEGYSVLVDRQNFDAGQRRTWVEIASEFPEVEVGCMVMGTSKQDCRERLLVRQDHPTIDNPDLAVQLLDKFSSLWQEPTLDEGFDRLITLPPLPPRAEIDATLIQSLLNLLHASTLNPSARQQRQPRPREPYRRPDGFVDDGTWRPPPRGTYGQRGGYLRSVQHQQPPRGGYGYYGSGRGAGYSAGGGWQGYGSNPAAYGAGQAAYGSQPQQSWRGGYAGRGGQGIAPRGGHAQQGAGHTWGQGQRLGGDAAGPHSNTTQPGL
ncbi:hypothetical protein JCM10049v2_005217 [Rhodotorula toruloides]